MNEPGSYVFVKFNGDDDTAIVRKTVVDKDGLVEAVYGLSRNGKWIVRPPGECYAEECLLTARVSWYTAWPTEITEDKAEAK